MDHRSPAIDIVEQGDRSTQWRHPESQTKCQWLPALSQIARWIIVWSEFCTSFLQRNCMLQFRPCASRTWGTARVTANTQKSPRVSSLCPLMRCHQSSKWSHLKQDVKINSWGSQSENCTCSTDQSLPQPSKIMANETMASLVIVTPNIKCSAANKTNGLAFRITVKVDSVVYILGHEDTNNR